MAIDKRYLAACLFVALTFAANPAAALENGKPDRGHRAVGALGFVPVFPGFETPLGFCTAFIISDSAVVTAAHCTATFAPIASSFNFTNEAGSPWDPVLEPGIFDLADLDLTPPGITIPLPEILVDTVGVSPESVDYCGSGTLPLLIVPDVAVLVFPAGTFDVPPVRLPPTGFVEELAELGVLGEVPAHLVGYGAAEELGGGEIYGPGYRQRGLSRLSDPVADPLADPTGLDQAWLYTEPDEIFDAGPLSGDSGSPLIIEGTAIALKGRPLGLPNDNAYQRLDTPDVIACLAPYVTP